ncbi:MAG TPA: flagellar filament capping protein FliD [Sandaracinaceae bacterium LLY-WYZ-13_1]|nr:flagellar filament capping protein FliD [Sandaracinaceae bacterium LLY-WYZ-13_1]
MSEITFSGLASGIDSASIISQLMRLERRPITRLQSKQRVIDSQASKLRSLKSKLTALQDAAGALSETDDVLATKVSSSDEGVFTATGTGNAALGPTSIHVTSLATAEKTYSDTFADAQTSGLFGTGTLSIQVGTDDAVDVTVEAGDTLESLVGKINGSGADVTAGLVFDGTSYRLRVTGNDTGADRAVAFTETGTTLGLDAPANEVQAAADAVFTVDGLAMTRSSNAFSDAVPGVTITLNGESPDATPATLSVERDPEALREKAQKLVDSYNDVMQTINGEFAYTGAPKGPDSLSGDSTLRSIQSQLRSRVGSGVEGTEGAYQTLASIGIRSNTDGTLQLEAGELDEALAADPASVATLLAGNGGTVDGFVSGFDDLLESFVDDSEGVLSSRIDSLEGRKRGIDDQIDRLELRMDDTEARLRQQYAKLEQTVSGLQSQGDQMMAALVGLGG